MSTSVLFLVECEDRTMEKNEAMFGYLHSSHKIDLIVTVHRTQVKSLNVSQKRAACFGRNIRIRF